MRKLISLLCVNLCIVVSFSCMAQNESTFAAEFPQQNCIAEITDYAPIEKGKCLLRMSHNNDEVFVQLVVKDKATQQKFIMQGLTMYIDITGKKNKKYGVVFPKANFEMMRNAMPERRESSEQAPRKAPEMSMKPLVSQLIFEPSILQAEDGEFYLDRSKAIVDTVDDDVVFACTLPYSMIGKKMGKKKKVAIGLVAGAQASAGGNGEAPSGGMPGAGGGMPGGGAPGGGMGGGPMGGGGSPGGMPPGGGRGPQGGNNEMSKAYNQWVVFTL